MDTRPEIEKFDEALETAAEIGAVVVTKAMRVLKCDLKIALKILMGRTLEKYLKGAKKQVVNDLDEMAEALKKNIEEQAKQDREERESNVNVTVVHPGLAHPDDEEPAK